MSDPAAHSQVETSTPKELVREPLVLNNRPLGWITNQVAGIIEGDMPKWWNIAFGVSFLLMLMSFGYIGYLITTGVGVWGLNNPVAWGWAIVNFVFWIGIGHAGTLISAILFLLRQKWRTSVNRTAEAMTIFAVICAGIFPGIHVGRICWRGGSSRCQTPMQFGRSSARRSCGMCLRCPRISQSHCCSGIWALFRIWRLFAIGCVRTRASARPAWTR